MAEPALKELMQSILRAQDRNNRARTRELRSRATKGFKEVFDQVPSLLHFNLPGLPGYLPEEGAPHGLLFYDEWLSGAEGLSSCAWPAGPGPARPVVESLMLIGSSGSVGHTARSDLDYWVCYRPGLLSGRELALFRRKLAEVSAWASDRHDTECNFYLVDLLELSKGRLANELNPEQDGDVAPMLLLEEFYRTMILVAGRVPLWAIWPLGLGAGEYRREAALMAPLDWELEPPRWVDLGFPEKAAPQEYLAAAMWLTCKSEADPFKGILKIMPILEALETDFRAPFLCDSVKAGVIANQDPSVAVDPYIITIDRVIAFALTHLTPLQLNLIRDAAILKVLGLTGRDGGEAQLAPDPSKDRVISGWIADWGWPPERLRRLLGYNAWTDRERLDQGYDLSLLLFNVYMRISNKLMSQFPGEVNASHNELLPFAARILGRQNGLEHTVGLLPSKFHRDSLSHRLAVLRDPGGEAFGVYDFSEGADLGSLRLDESRRLHETKWAAKAAAWIVGNGLHGGGFTISLPEGNGSLPAEPDFLDYLGALAKAFPPLSFADLDPESVWSAGASGPVLLCLNFGLPQGDGRISTVDVVYRTGWGELRHQHLELSRHGSEADKFHALGKLLLGPIGLSDVRNLVDATPSPTKALGRAFRNLRAALAAGLQRTSAMQNGQGSMSRIDI
ncbi:MAG: class I adenylate cyclase [Deltaproteobacteria bacterium]|jgi:adenylate cyclase class 1|nr:class I adenylate cyclase [Deltaproteobacteria bacterium]